MNLFSTDCCLHVFDWMGLRVVLLRLFVLPVLIRRLTVEVDSVIFLPGFVMQFVCILSSDLFVSTAHVFFSISN